MDNCLVCDSERLKNTYGCKKKSRSHKYALKFKSDILLLKVSMSKASMSFWYEYLNKSDEVFTWQLYEKLVKCLSILAQLRTALKHSMVLIHLQSFNKKIIFLKIKSDTVHSEVTLHCNHSITLSFTKFVMHMKRKISKASAIQQDVNIHIWDLLRVDPSHQINTIQRFSSSRFQGM